MNGNDLFDDIGDYYDDEVGPTKSQLKRDMHALQALGEQLTRLPAADLEKIELPETLRRALADFARFDSHIARRRQLQFIGRLMRDTDPEPIRRALDAIKHNARQAAQQQHLVEQWRDRILNEGDTAINALMETHPQADRQKLRQFERQARKEQEQNKPPAAARALFKYLREVIAA